MENSYHDNRANCNSRVTDKHQQLNVSSFVKSKPICMNYLLFFSLYYPSTTSKQLTLIFKWGVFSIEVEKVSCSREKNKINHPLIYFNITLVNHVSWSIYLMNH